MSKPKFTRADVLAYAELLRSLGKHVRYVDADSNIVEGVARHIVVSPDNFGFPPFGDDIRDCYLRITRIEGFDVTLSTERVAELIRNHEFVIDK